MSEIIELRGKNSKVFSLGASKYRFEIGNHFHTKKNNLWIPVDTTIEPGVGLDPITGSNYMARSRFSALDYDISFSQANPLFLKVHHLPTNQVITIQPTSNNVLAETEIIGNRMAIGQAWPGVDVEILILDYGLKINFLITSPLGQRVVQFTLNGNIERFLIGNAFVLRDGEPAIIPTSFSEGVLSYDFRTLNVGTKIDPTIEIDESKTLSVYSLVNTNPDWGVLIEEDACDSATEVTTGAVRIGRVVGPTLSASRGYFAIDTSAVSAEITLTSAILYVTPSTLSPAAESIIIQKSTNTNTPANTGTWDEVEAVVGSPTSISGAVVNTELELDVPVGAIIPGGVTKLLTRNYEKDYSNTAPGSETQRFYAYGPQDATSSYRPHMAINYSLSESSIKEKPYKFANDPQNPFKWR